ncbi:hypothetical protein CcI156_19720 [Frankia sp. CcI156]|nr:hypothetical protein Manayef4_18840 [Frankia sp. CgIM4]OHV51149.1 hypothetical protein CgIS1_19365 [Frankia sp. CgIS1]ONH23062.1 hypothetical protein CcI156_19720 [Frankia sp. CcI156]ORT46712.1 hypothetical protein KBI5_23725 [Frankia sp. KB5]ORT96184.1 hypothetical protein UK99_10205 [Frankia casuarinae]
MRCWARAFVLASCSACARALTVALRVTGRPADVRRDRESRSRQKGAAVNPTTINGDDDDG